MEQNRPVSPSSSSELENGQLSLFDFVDLNQQNKEGKTQFPILSGALPQKVIDEALCIGANERNSRLIICAYFKKDKQDNARFLSEHYGENGAGFYLDGRQYAIWYNAEGIRIAQGESAQRSSATLISWEQAAAHIRELLDLGRYMPQSELDRVDGYERQQRAEHLWYLRRDFAEGTADAGYLPTVNAMYGTRRGFPEESAAIQGLLNQPETLKTVRDELEQFVRAYRENRELLRFHVHRPQKLLEQLSDLQREPLHFTAEEGYAPQRRLFISSDEIDNLLRGGNQDHDYRLDVYSFYRNHTDRKEREDFLKNYHGEYQGRCSGNDNVTYTRSKGIFFSHGTDPKVELKWPAVEKRVSGMIAQGRFLADEDRAAMPQYEKHKLARNIRTFFENVPQEQPHPYPFGSDYWDAVKLIEPQLDDPARVEEIYQMMVPVWEATPKNDRRYELRRQAFENLTAFRQGTFTLFAEHKEPAPLPPVLTPEQVQLEQAKELIDQFCQAEFDSPADFSNLEQVDLAYTTVTDKEIPIQVTVDLVHYRVERYLDGQLLERRQHESLEELIQNELTQLDFDQLTSVEQEHLNEKNPPNAEPYIICQWSESPAFEGGKRYDILEFDRLMRQANEERVAGTKAALEKYGTYEAWYEADDPEAAQFLGYDKVQFSLVMPNGEVFTERQDVGDGDGGVLDFLGQYPKYQGIIPLLQPVTPAEPAEVTKPDAYEELVGKEVTLDGHRFMVEGVSNFSNDVTLRDLTFQGDAGVPISRIEKVGLVRRLLKEQEQTSLLSQRRNFHITDSSLGLGTPKEKYSANTAAIRTLKQIEAEKRLATPEEQEILSRYVGWGGLADAFDGDKESWRKEHQQLQELLTPEEYAAARASTLTAHYTSPAIIKSIYAALERMGFQGGNILEPSCGVGNFFGLLPESMTGSQLYGVELDSVTGRIAQQLYQQAEITVAGFETTDRRDFYDVAIGNVPFGNYQVNDVAYNKLGFSIHNYFFAKALDQVRPGGIVAFVTSRHTMDAKDTKVRRYLAQRAELLGAIRLPNNAFKGNAGTEVVADILFLQRRERLANEIPDWVQTEQTKDGFSVNSYFIAHPNMVLGQSGVKSTAYGPAYDVSPLEGVALEELLSSAVARIQEGGYHEEELPDVGEGIPEDTSRPADQRLKNYSFGLVDGMIFYRENSRMFQPQLSASAAERIRDMIALRDCAYRLIEQQTKAETPEETISATMAELNHQYDAFEKKHGRINSRANKLVFAKDDSYALLSALEVCDEEGQFLRKADIFSKRTIAPHQVATRVDTASEALVLSISEKACVDLPYMSQLTGKDEKTIVSELKGVIFQLPGEPGRYQSAEEYLSGNVRKKLREARQAAAENPAFQPNVEALLAAQPKDLTAAEIEVRLGSTWIDKKYIAQFMLETLKPPAYLHRYVRVNFSPLTAEWEISGKTMVDGRDVLAHTTYGTKRASAYKLLEDALNLRDTRIYDIKLDENGTERRVLNSKETTLAQQKQQALKEAFRSWIWKEPDRRKELVKKYNEEMNATRPREYDGSHISFGGMNPSITLREHQRNAIAHILYGGNTLLAHEVGAGKTFEMVAAAMESKRLGLCHKSLFVVPNHLIEQWGAEFLRLYPAANVLITRQTDFEPHNRKRFCARIATGNYDAIIMGHSQFEKIPISRERQERLLEEQVNMLTAGINEAKEKRGERFTVKQLERSRKQLATKLEKLRAAEKKDDVVTFEQLGVDRLFVDEAHNYKNLFLYTKMRNVAGLSTSEAQKSSDMFAKCRYMDELTGGKGVVFATGTPISNSMTELYTMQRYLQYSRLEELNMTHFDAWASHFGETVTALELAPEGTGYRARTRFSKFFNLPELMNIFREVADIKTADQLSLPVPEAEYHNIAAKPTRIQEAMVKELSRRASAVHSNRVDPSQDNMLKITSDGRKLGLDQRIIKPELPDESGSKVNLCVENILRIWREGESEKLTQLVFCDISTPKPGSKDSSQGFTVYADIRNKLIAAGMPEKEIAFIHDADTDAKKKKLFAKVRSGQVRVLMGSTAKMGAGTNVQDRLGALHDLDCPRRPGDLDQRRGRIVRQGNKNPLVHIYRYVTEGTFDAYLWQTIENKQKFIGQIMTSKTPARSCNDVDEAALSYAEIKALCAGDPRIKERMDLEVEVTKLKLMKGDHENNIHQMQDQLLSYFPQEIKKQKLVVTQMKSDIQLVEANPLTKDGGFVGMTVRGVNYTEKEAAGAALMEACQDSCRERDDLVPIGSYRGFNLIVNFDVVRREFRVLLQGKLAHPVVLGTDPRGNITRLDNGLSEMPRRMEIIQARLQELEQQKSDAEEMVEKPFSYEAELQAKSARIVELDVALNMGHTIPQRSQGRER